MYMSYRVKGMKEERVKARARKKNKGNDNEKGKEQYEKWFIHSYMFIYKLYTYLYILYTYVCTYTHIKTIFFKVINYKKNNK